MNGGGRSLEILSIPMKLVTIDLFYLQSTHLGNAHDIDDNKICNIFKELTLKIFIVLITIDLLYF